MKNPSTNRTKAESRVIAAAMRRYKEWLGEAQNWNPIRATKAQTELVESCRLLAAARKRK